MATAGAWESVRPAHDAAYRLLPSTLHVLHQGFGFHTMTPVQAATLPLFLGHKDVAVDACTGSGKTLAFVVPVVEKLMRRDQVLRKGTVGALILTPTRELATQIGVTVKAFLEHEDVYLTYMVIIGGVPIERQMERWQAHGAHIIVATPGRLVDFWNRAPPASFRDNFEVLVLDEADRLLEAGFKSDVDSIMARLPKVRRTGLFSATQTQEVRQLLRAGMRNCVRVQVQVENKETQDLQTTPVALNNFYAVVELRRKVDALVHVLQQQSSKKVIVFFLTCATVNFFYKLLPRVKCLSKRRFFSLHGKVPQRNRKKTMQQFRDESEGILLCTDVAARGLDVADVTFIVQFDPPQDPTVFVHRIGRTARLDRRGTAVVFVTPPEMAFVDYLGVKKIPIAEWTKLPKKLKSVFGEIRSVQCQYRSVYEAGREAMVSHYRAYREHILSYIFQLRTLNLGDLAMSWGLPHLPKMPELRDEKAAASFQAASMAADAIPYANAKMEMDRKRKLKRTQARRRRAIERSGLAPAEGVEEGKVAGNRGNKRGRKGRGEDVPPDGDNVQANGHQHDSGAAKAAKEGQASDATAWNRKRKRKRKKK